VGLGVAVSVEIVVPGLEEPPVDVAVGAGPFEKRLQPASRKVRAAQAAARPRVGVLERFIVAEL
jgi:hypothetical protein